MKILITGGTVFLSKITAEYYISRGHDVYVLNRNTKPQPQNANLIQADRHALGNSLRGCNFDVVIDVTAYNADDVNELVSAMGDFGCYILISSSAVYPDTEKQPFTEETPIGKNNYWGDYGLGKISAENATLRLSDCYIIRPPYIYGEYNNIYREAFVFDCAVADRPFFIPNMGNLTLQFIHAEDVCRFTEILINVKPTQRIFNLGTMPISAKEWVTTCYSSANKSPTFVYTDKTIEQRNYFPFYDYRYALDHSAADKLMPSVIVLENGLKRAYAQYIIDSSYVNRKDYFKYIDENLKPTYKYK